MKTDTDQKFSDDFLRGQHDCMKGIEHTDQSDAYTRGYRTQYEAEQAAEWRERKCS